MSSNVLLGLLLLFQLNPSLSQLTSQNQSYYSSDGCTVHFPAINTSFGVCSAKILTFTDQNQGHYKVKDARWDEEKSEKYEYYFNVANALPLEGIPESCRNLSMLSGHGYCNQSNCDTLNKINNAWAYQIKLINKTNNTETACWALSNDIGGEPEWSLINPNNPVDGVRLTYINGDYSTACGRNRKFSINFHCENNEIDFNPQNSETYIYETTNKCEYQLDVNTPFGCPLECPPSLNYGICYSNGLCSFDDSIDAPRCYCYRYFEDDDCSVQNMGQVDKDSALDSNKPPPNSSSPYVHSFDTININNITYDLNAFGGKTYTILDKSNGVNSRNYTYYIGILYNISIPNECNTVQGLDGHILNDNETLLFKAYAFQIDAKTGDCYVLGSVANWGLYDQIDDPAHGVVITYSEGGICGDRKRQFSISMVCPDGAKDALYNKSMETTIETFVKEDDVKCSYNIEIESAFACPYQCLTDTDRTDIFSVCTQRGLCVADPHANRVRCLCDTGYIGIQCQSIDTVSPTVSPTKDPTVSPTNAPTDIPTTSPTKVPTKLPTIRPSKTPTTQKPSKSPTVTKVVIEEASDSHSGFIISITVLCLCFVGALIFAYCCWKNMKKKHEEYKQYSEFRDQTKKKKLVGSTGFSIHSIGRKSKKLAGSANMPVDDYSDDDNDDTLL